MLYIITPTNLHDSPGQTDAQWGEVSGGLQD